MRLRAARVRAAMALGVGAMLSLVACGHATVRSDKTAEFVAENVQRETGFKPADVRCPGGIAATVGAQFDCQFTGPTGPYLAHLEITEVEGDHVTYEYDIEPVA